MKKLLLIVYFIAPLSAHAQATNTSFPVVPQISVTGHGETKVSSDRATIQISVQTRANTAAAAGSLNASKQRAVLDALKRLGLPDEQLSTANYSVTPEQRYEPNRAPVITGYTVTNTIIADVRDLARVGPIIDAALGAGANVISSLQFYASNPEGARQASITEAIQTAKAEASVAARAAGGSLGELLDIGIGSYYSTPPRPVYMMRAEAASQSPETPVNAGQETVTVDVSTRWRFIPAK